MKSSNIKISLIILFLLTLSLFSCDKVEKTAQVSVNENVETSTKKSNKKNEISPIANEPWFRNDIHMLSNPTNRVNSLVKGDGTILLTTLEPDIESIGKITDVNSKVTNYIYKNYTGENYIKKNISNTEEEFIDAIPTQKCIVYDRNGNETGLIVNIYSPNYSSKNIIIYSDEVDGSTGAYVAYNVNTKQNQIIECDEIYVMNNRFLLSTSPWNDNVKSEEILVCDENLDFVNKIEGYSIDGVTKTENIEFASLRKKIKGGDDPEFKYNFLNSNFEIMFESDVDERIWTGDPTKISLRTGNKIVDYSFLDNKIVGEEREYNKEKEEIENKNEEEYSKMEKKIQDDNKKDGVEKYTYVSRFNHDNQILYIGHKHGNLGMFDYDAIDVFDENGEKLAEFDDLSNQFSELGYLFVNHDTMYDINMNVVGTLKEKRNIEMYTKFDKTYFNDGTGLDYGLVKPFSLYNEKMEPILENLECIEMNSFDDYIMIVDSEGTKLLDKELNVVKKLDRKLDIKPWYDNVTTNKVFEDLDTGRMGIIDKDLNIIVDKMKYIGELENKYFTYQNGFEYGFMDYEGRPIIKYSIFDTMMEDANSADFRGDYIIKYDDYE